MWRTRERLDRLKGDLLFMTKAALLGGAVGMGLIIVFAPTIATDVFGDPRESTILRTLAFAVPSWNLLKLILGIAAGFKRPGLKVIIEDFVLSACLLGVAVTATWLNLNPADVAIGYAFSYGVTGVTGSILIARLRDIRSLATVDSVSSIGSLLSFSWPLILVGMLGKVTGMTDILILGGLAPASDVGLYRVASDLAVTLSILLMVFGFLYLPVASELHAHGNREGWKDLNGRVARWAMLLGFPVFAILYFRSEDVVTLFYGAEFGASSLALKILAVGYFFHIMVGFTGTNLTVDGRTKSQLVVHLAAFGVNIVGNLTLVPIIGIEGAATATLASLVIVNAASIVLTFRWLGIQPFGSRYLIALILLLAGAYFLDFLSRVLFAGLRSAIVFAASIVALWFVLFLLRISADPSDITLAKRLIARRDAAA